MAVRFPRWRFILIDSRDMTRVQQLRRATGKSLSVKNNISGKVDYSYPMKDEYAAEIVPYETGILAERYNWRATLDHIDGGGKGEIWDPIWSGYTLPIGEQITNDKMQISCVGWLQRLEKRITRKIFTWNNIDDSVIIKDLLDHANGIDGPDWAVGGDGIGEWLEHINFCDMAGDAFEIRWPTGNVPNTPTHMKWGGTAPNEGAGGATAYVAQLRSHSVQRRVNILPEIERMTELENGCDIFVDPLLRELTVQRRRERIRKNVDVAFNWGPKNVSEFTRNIDAEKQVNYLLAQGDPLIAPAHAFDYDSMERVGPLEEVAQLGTVKQPSVLLAYAGAEIIVRKDGVITYGITPFTYTSENSVPEPFVDYQPGDSIFATAILPPRITNQILRQQVRVFGMNVNIDDNTGAEKLGQLVLSP